MKAALLLAQGKTEYYKNHETDTALELFNQALNLNPGLAMAYAEKANVLRFQGKKQEALEQSQIAINIDNQCLIAYYVQIRILVALGDESKAWDVYQAIPEVSRNHPAESFFHQGSALSDLGKKQEAIECFDKVISLNPKDADAYLNKGAALYSLGEDKEAIACYDIGISLDPNNASAYLNKGLALYGLGKKREAIECFDKVISLDPDDANAYYVKGLALSDLGDDKEAIACYDIGISLNPDDANAYFVKGSALYGLGDDKEAIACYDIGISLDSNNASAYLNKGAALSDLGKKQEAIECWDKAISLNPNNALYLCRRGQVLQELRKKDLAIKDFKIAKSLFDQGNVQGLSEGNIEYVEAILASVVDLLNVVDAIDAKAKRLDSLLSKDVIEQINQLRQDSNKVIDNTFKNFDPTNKGECKNNQENLSSIAWLTDKYKELEAKIEMVQVDVPNFKQEVRYIKEELWQKLDKHGLILEKKLASFGGIEKQKLMTYFTEFSKCLKQNYVASVTIASGIVGGKAGDGDLQFDDVKSILGEYASKLLNTTTNVITETDSSVPFIGIVFSAFKDAKKYVEMEKLKNQIIAIANIAHNTAAFDDIVGAVATQITLGKLQDILSLKEDQSSFKFLSNEKDLINESLGKIEIEPEHLKHIVTMANKDSTMLVTACILGKITSEYDDANYSATKEQFISMILYNPGFKVDFDTVIAGKMMHTYEIENDFRNNGSFDYCVQLKYNNSLINQCTDQDLPVTLDILNNTDFQTKMAGLSNFE
jgi:tetratricopeptide (TPR) repeat protein